MNVSKFREHSMIVNFGALLLLGASVPSTQIQQGLNDFTFRLIRETLKGSKGNECVSPLSISICLSTAMAGAKGATLDDLRNGLGYGSQDVGAINAGNKQLTDQLANAAGKPFVIANSVWVDTKTPLTPGYVKDAKAFYDSDIFTVPKFDSHAIDRINAWTKEKTKGRIERILEQASPGMVMVLVNALTFDADWELKFDTRATRTEKFHTSASTSVETAMMHSNRKVPYWEGPNGKAVRLAYKGKQFSLILLLPKDGFDAAGLLRNTNSQSYAQIMQSLHLSRQVTLSFPKFKIQRDYDLIPPLSSLGMPRLFSAADFSGISKSLARSRVNKIVQKTYFKVDEKGTEAAAATGMVFGRMAMEPAFFQADRPFAYLLVDDRTHAILFAGVCAKP